ncbi:glycosyltransferase family 2 protein [Xenorhabdus budapestensis]|uniref:Glycosyltransferase family 2 protein n=1 Tax=Xenorhabdus budapestensis TaxID=290110 RepID=A0ABX7VLQ4_XENBU|nr:glycosyltransferase family 2 protein [Xenorhabdus budapestensis]QTL39798.1 glycosyltransferase family 2 protein [Xenorhabdus budapestensis]
MKISFCIPTYNRARFLEELLESIANQSNHSLDIEVCISDNASTDGTSDMIAIWGKKFNFPIKYHCHDNNIGPDRNYLSAINMGTGDYCWIFGSDDMLEIGALAQIQDLLFEEHDIYLCDRKEMDITMSIVRNSHRKWLSCGSSTFLINDNKDLINYLNKCQSIGGVFSYLSSIIVKKEKWNTIEFDESYVGTAYSHVYILLRILNHKGTILKYISSPLVLCRGDNDFFVSSGMAKRIKIDFIGYLKLSNDLYTESCSITQALHGVLLRERPWLYTSLAMACYGNQEDKRHLLYYYEEMGYSKFLTEFIFLWGGLARYLKNSGKLKSFIRKIKL